jgi:methylthioribulose-1-phosphate dehydratase
MEPRAQLLDVVSRLYERGLAVGTSGNFSRVLTGDRLLVTQSGADKGRLTTEHLLVVDHDGRVIEGSGTPSAETALHVAIVRHRGAGSVLHVHSVWNTILSTRFAAAGRIEIAGYEMLKGLAGIATHEHTEVVPVVANAQDMTALVRDATRALDDNPAAHGFLIAGHGLYTWGRDVAEAHRHVEIFEFLFEVVGRQLLER